MTDETAAEPVLFRMAKDEHGEYLTAVFPRQLGTDDPWSMGCYAHVGQHGSCSTDWYRTTWPAKPEQYTDLAAELQSKPYEYVLQIRSRITQADYEFRREALKAYR